jgi:phosphoribosylaminoimidazolecarboxamide formyltransferase/IMP cyclohydrolase
MRAIISVSNKSGVADFAKGLTELGWEVFSTGGTKKTLQESGVEVHSVSELTGFPEILGGRVKTLHPAVHGGILARRDLPEHMSELEANKMGPIDMVVVNLYPFVQTVSRAGVSLEEAVENIDIGGPTMIRSAAKNFASVLVVVDPADYEEVLKRLQQGNVDEQVRKRLAQKAFRHVALYDTAISQYLREETFPSEMTVALKRAYDLRYGENPHQSAAFYLEQDVKTDKEGLASLTHLSGPEISFNNILDFDAALSVLRSYSGPTVAVMKHTNPCGLAGNENLSKAYMEALAGDPVAAFGGVVAANRTIDVSTAREIDKTHYDAIVAPGYEEEAFKLLSQKKNLRLVQVPVPAHMSTNLDFRRVEGGFLVQTADLFGDDELRPRSVSRREATQQEMEDLVFAWKAVRGIKSNAIVIAKNGALMGMGAGQPSRVVAVGLALQRAGDRAKGAVLASDAFFPFPDGPEMALKAGVTALIQPGGSVRDSDVIQVVDRFGAAMLFTGRRHFRH